VEYRVLLYCKHLFWWIAQFDWLLTRHDIPVLHVHGQYAIFIALLREPSSNRQKVSKSLSNYSKRTKINNNCHICVLTICEELQILFADSQEEFYTILNKKYNFSSHRFIIFSWKFLFLLDKKRHKYEMKRTKKYLSILFIGLYYKFYCFHICCL
jgi:hypothetical protein